MPDLSFSQDHVKAELRLVAREDPEFLSNEVKDMFNKGIIKPNALEEITPVFVRRLHTISSVIAGFWIVVLVTALVASFNLGNSAAAIAAIGPVLAALLLLAAILKHR